MKPWLAYIKGKVYRYRRNRILKNIFNILRKTRSHRKHALMEALEGCSPFVHWHIKCSPEMLFVAPFIFLREDNYNFLVPYKYGAMIFTKKKFTYYVTKYIVTKLPYRLSLRHEKMGDSKLPKHVLPLEPYVPLKAQVEFLEGVMREYEGILQKKGDTQAKRVHDAETSEVLTITYPYLKEKNLSQHIWFTCPYCQGVSVVPPERVESHTLCPYCNDDIVLTLDGTSMIANTYPLLLEE